MLQSSNIGQRGKSLISKVDDNQSNLDSYFKHHMNVAFENPYSESNPNGKISFAVAEY